MALTECGNISEISEISEKCEGFGVRDSRW